MAPVLIALVAGSISALVHLQSISSAPLKQFLDGSVVVEGVVSTDPSRTRAKVIGSRLIEPRSTFLLRAEKIGNTNKSLQGIRVPIRIITEDQSPFFPGERISLNGFLIKSKERKVAASLIVGDDATTSISRPFSLGLLEEIRTALRGQASRIGGDSASLLPGMIIGDTSLQSPSFTEVMQRAGLSHLTAVSGANFAIVSAFLFALIGWILPNRKLQAIATILALALFVLIARPTPSVLRAALMASVYLVAKLSGRRSVAINSLAMAVAILLLINPLQAFEAGFILSVLATLGLIFLAPKISQKIPGPSFVGDLIAIPTSATLACSPYLIYLSGALNLGTIALNILVAPVVPFVTILAFLALLLALPAGPIAGFFLEIANFGASWISMVATWSGFFPELSTSPMLILFLALALTLAATFFRAIGARLLIIVLLLLTLFGSANRVLFPGSNWQIGQCDVGQGDALLVNLGEGSAILFDAGPDPVALGRCLKMFAIDSLPLVVISHSHADHYQGLPGVGNRVIGQIWSNSQLEIFQTNPVKIVGAGTQAKVGNANVSIIWPDESLTNFESIEGDGSAENNRSLVTLVEIDQIKLLVTGDIEPGAQRQILEAIDLSELDVMKVPHHGSRFQESELFEGSKLFLISVGQNSYGHPDQGLISRLEEIGELFRTDKDGAISISRKGSATESNGKDPIFSVRRLGKEWWRFTWH